MKGFVLRLEMLDDFSVRFDRPKLQCSFSCSIAGTKHGPLKMAKKSFVFHRFVCCFSPQVFRTLSGTLGGSSHLVSGW